MKEDTFKKIDDLIRSGNFVTAKKYLLRISLTKVPERSVLKLADLLIRCGLFKQSARLLYPYVFEFKNTLDKRAMAYYAISLQQMGAYREALKFFEQLPFSLPEANFYYAIALFSQWEYQKAIPHLEVYINHDTITPYQKLVGSLNLALAHAAICNYSTAVQMLDVLEKKAAEQNYTLLLANALEIRAQILFDEKNYAGALNLLSTSDQLLKAAPSKYKVMVDFWTALINYAINPRSNSASEHLVKLRQQAVSLGSWPMVREIDRHRAIIDRDEQLFFKVYFGTPFLPYRERLLREFGEKITVPEFFLWNPTGKPALSTDVIDVNLGYDLRSGAQLKKGQTLHRLLQSLCSDFYIPFRPETIFSYLFDQEHYNPVNSNRRAREVIHRLQKWFEQNDIPIEIRRKTSDYRIFVQTPYSILVRKNYETLQSFRVDDEIEHLLRQGTKYTAKEMKTLLNLPLRTLYRKLDELLEKRRIVKERQGTFVYYKWE